MKKMEYSTFLENFATLKELLSRISPDAEISIPDIVVKIPIKSPMDEIARQLKFTVKSVSDKSDPLKTYKSIIIHLKKQEDFSKLAYRLDKLLDAAQKFVKKNPFDFSAKESSDKNKEKSKK